MSPAMWFAKLKGKRVRPELRCDTASSRSGLVSSFFRSIADDGSQTC